MRPVVLILSACSLVGLGAAGAASRVVQGGRAEDQLPPYHTHTDRRYGQDRLYPDRGAIVRDLPGGAITVNYAGLSYRFAGGVWYEAIGPAFMVVAPPIGLIVPTLPAFAANLDRNGKTYLYANDVFYQPRPDLGGYEVVNNPQDAAPQVARAPASPEERGHAVAKASAVAHSPAKPIVTTAAGGASLAQAAAPPYPAAQAKAPALRHATLPHALAHPVAESSDPTRIAIYPRNGQSAAQQATDRYDCYRYAVAESGFDPLASRSRPPSANAAQGESEYSQAQTACLDARGYTVR